MKTTSTFFAKTIVSSALVVTASLTAWSQDHNGFYVKTDLGGNVTLDTDLKEFFGPVVPGTKVKFDPGLRAGLAGGYQFINWLAVEGELGYYQNSIDKITGAYEMHDSWLANVPFMVNGRLQYPNRSPLTPYIGAGVGFTESILWADEINIGGTHLHGDLYDTEFAWQLFAGLRFRINEQMGLSVEYRYFEAEGPEWQADHTEGTLTDTMRFGRAQTHSLSLAFDFRF